MGKGIPISFWSLLHEVGLESEGNRDKKDKGRILHDIGSVEGAASQTDRRARIRARHGEGVGGRGWSWLASESCFHLALRLDFGP